MTPAPAPVLPPTNTQPEHTCCYHRICCECGLDWNNVNTTDQDIH